MLLVKVHLKSDHVHQMSNVNFYWAIVISEAVWLFPCFHGLPLPSSPPDLPHPY